LTLEVPYDGPDVKAFDLPVQVLLELVKGCVGAVHVGQVVLIMVIGQCLLAYHRLQRVVGVRQRRKLIPLERHHSRSQRGCGRNPL